MQAKEVSDQVRFLQGSNHNAKKTNRNICQAPVRGSLLCQRLPQVSRSLILWVGGVGDFKNNSTKWRQTAWPFARLKEGMEFSRGVMYVVQGEKWGDNGEG